MVAFRITLMTALAITGAWAMPKTLDGHHLVARDAATDADDLTAVKVPLVTARWETGSMHQRRSQPQARAVAGFNHAHEALSKLEARAKGDDDAPLRGFSKERWLHVCPKWAKTGLNFHGHPVQPKNRAICKQFGIIVPDATLTGASNPGDKDSKPDEKASPTPGHSTPTSPGKPIKNQ